MKIFFRIPKVDDAMLKKLTYLINKSGKKITSSFTICSDHFNEDLDFAVKGSRRYLLKSSLSRYMPLKEPIT